MAGIEVRKMANCQGEHRLYALEKRICVDVVKLSADVGHGWKIVPVAQDVIGSRGEHLACIDSFSPFGTSYLVDCFLIWQDSEIPGTTKTRQKINFIGD